MDFVGRGNSSMRWDTGWPPGERPASAATGLEAPSSLSMDLLGLEKERETERGLKSGVEGKGGGGQIGAKQARGWERLRERRKREGRHLNKTRSKWCLHDKGARHLPWLVSQRCTKAMQAPRCGVMCGAQACLCIQGVILGRNSRGPLSSFGLGNLCAYPWKEKKFPDHLFFLKTVLKLEETRMGGELMDTSSYAQLKMLFSAVVFFLITYTYWDAVIWPTL